MTEPDAASNDNHAFRLGDERFHLLVDAVKDYAILLLDGAGRVVSWNAGAQTIYGYAPEDVAMRSFAMFYPPEVAAGGWPQRELKFALEGGRFEDEGWRVRKDGSYFWANVVITTVRDASGRHQGFLKITRDLTERRRIEALELAGRRMTEFLAVLAHELRNPLAPMRNAVTVMRMKPLGDPSLVWSRDIIDRQLTHLTRLVDDLIDVSRITSGKITLARQPLEMAVVAARAVESSRPLIEARGQKLEIDFPRDPVLVEGDLTRLAQVVTNLLNNASKYTSDGGWIGLSVRAEGNQAILSVRDNGIGISKELIPSIFDLFTQGDLSADRTTGGLGIGLTLVQRLVRMHGGSVEARSEGEDRGSEFIVRLPRLAGVAPARTAEERAPRAPVPTPPRSILVVDDNRDSADSMSTVLRLMGHDVRTANDGPGALEVARVFRPEVVLLDIGIPEMSGYEVARRLRDIPSVRAATLIAMTGYGQADDRARTREAGFDHHLVKPVDIDEVRMLLQTQNGEPAKMDS